MNRFTNPTRIKYLPLAVLISLFLVTRLLILFSGVDNFFLDEELVAGTIAKMLISGMSPCFIFSCFGNNHWGIVVGGILTVPFFLLFGESLVVLRSVAMFFSLGTLILLYLFLYKSFNKKAAVLASLLFILSPPHYIKMSFIFVGGYAETNFFSILAFFIFYKLFFAKGAAPRRHLYALFGFVCGFALFYDYIFLLTLSCCLISWFIFDRGMLVRKKFYIFLTFFLFGFSPWFYYNITHNWNAVFVIRGQSLIALFTNNSFLNWLNQLKFLIFFVIPSYFTFKGFFFINKAVISHLYYFILAIAFIGFFWLQRRSIARSFSGVILPRRFNISAGVISPETPLIIYVTIFALSYAFCGVSQFSEDDSIAFPQRLVAYIIPHIFMITAIFLVKISSHRHGARASRMLVYALIIIGLINTLGMISMQSYTISSLPEGYNYLFVGRLFREKYGDDIRPSSNFVKTIDKKQRQLFYAGRKWAIPTINQDFSIAAYIHTAIQGAIDKDYWPFAYEHLGRAMGHSQRFGTSVDDEFKGQVAQAFHPYFYRGLGRSCVDKEFSEGKYTHLLGIIDKQYWPSFREGMGIEMDAMFIQDTQAFTRFMSTLATEAKTDIYRGLAQGREYPRINYREFYLGFGQILPSTQEWRKRIDTIEEEFKPYCYQRLGIEIGWRFIYGIKGYQDFLQKADEKYKPHMYRGLGIGIGWRFGYNIRGCAALIQQTEQRYRAYLYEGLGTGVARRYGYRMDEQTQEREAAQVPGEFRNQFRKGLQEGDGV